MNKFPRCVAKLEDSKGIWGYRIEESYGIFRDITRASFIHNYESGKLYCSNVTVQRNYRINCDAKSIKLKRETCDIEPKYRRSITDYKKYCRDYKIFINSKNKTPQKILDINSGGIEDRNSRGLASLADLDLVILNGKVFIAKIRIPKRAAKNVIKLSIPNTIFGILINKDSCLFEYPDALEDRRELAKMNVVIQGDRPLVCLDANSKLDSEVDEFNAITGGMFKDCKFLQDINLINFEPGFMELESMFSGCNNLGRVSLGEKFKTLNNRNASRMFYSCEKLKKVHFGEYLYTVNIENMESMFDGCRMIEELDFGDYFNTVNLKNLDNIFNNCQSLNILKIRHKLYTDSIPKENMRYGMLGHNVCKAVRDLESLLIDSYKPKRIRKTKT